MKQRMVAGYNLQHSGVIAPGEPITATAKIPDNATPLSMEIDVQGNMVLFCEVWSHPEGTEVKFSEPEFCLVPPRAVVPAGSWTYWCMAVSGPVAFAVYRKEARILQ